VEFNGQRMRDKSMERWTEDDDGKIMERGMEAGKTDKRD